MFLRKNSAAAATARETLDGRLQEAGACDHDLVILGGGVLALKRTVSPVQVDTRNRTVSTILTFDPNHPSLGPIATLTEEGRLDRDPAVGDRLVGRVHAVSLEHDLHAADAVRQIQAANPRPVSFA